jgi:predicted RNA-binding protein with PUA-like domain
MGLAEVVKSAYPDHTALDPTSYYFDEKAAKKGNNPWLMVDVQAKLRFKQPLRLADIRQMANLKDLALLKPGQRLSIQPVSAQHAAILLKLT